MDTVQKVLEANAHAKAAGAQLLAALPWHRKMEARVRSLLLLSVVAAAFWPTAYAVAVICVVYHGAVWLLKRQRQWQSDHMQRSSTTGSYNKQTSTLSPQTPQKHLQPGDDDRIPASYPATHSLLTTPQPQAVQQAPKGTAIVTGGKMTKALHVCRHLHAAGWRVVLLETHKYWHVGARLSNSVSKFLTVPVPEDQPDEYVKAISDIAKQEGASLFIPVSSPIASLYDALAGQALPPGCRSWTLSPDTTAKFDNKVRFSDYAASLGLKVPDHHLVSSPADLRRLNDAELLKGKAFILKNLAYDSVHRADLFKLPCEPSKLEAYLARPDITISPQQPWILQEFIKGKEYSSYSLAYQGRVVAHADTAAMLSNLNYKYEAHPGIRQWVQQFVQRSGVTGQLCLDFMELDGQLYCIECNPRTSTVITEFHDNPQLATAFTDPDSIKRTVEPLPDSRPTYWWFNEVARLITQPGSYLWKFLVVVTQGVDGVFEVSDPLPFLGLHFIQIPVLLLGNIWRGNPWTKVDVNIGKIAELYGD